MTILIKMVSIYFTVVLQLMKRPLVLEILTTLKFYYWPIGFGSLTPLYTAIIVTLEITHLFPPL